MGASSTPPTRDRRHWWGGGDDDVVAEAVRRRRRRTTAWQRLVRNPRFRSFTRRTTILVMVSVLIASSVGVITLNNLVVRRSAELGQLDDERRQLRTDNALLSADIARLSAPPRITRLARTRLGMRPSDTMSRFIYLDPANQPPRRKRKRNRAQQATTSQSATATGTATTTTPAPTTEPEAGLQ